MNGIGGDNFWLVRPPGQAPVGIDASGAAGRLVEPRLYSEHGLDKIPTRGPLVVNTVAGAVGGWDAALSLARELGGNLSIGRLLEDAIAHARNGAPLPALAQRLLMRNRAELEPTPGFAETFFAVADTEHVPVELSQPRLAATLEQLAKEGLDSFYRGQLAERIAADFRHVGSPLTLEDLADFATAPMTPLKLELQSGTLFNLPPPTQGLVSLMIVGMFEQLQVAVPESFLHVHGIVEATKQALMVRDTVITDPRWMKQDPNGFLTPEILSRCAAAIDPVRASPLPNVGTPGDTVWIGVIDAQGCAVSMLQSLFQDFGSGVVLPDTGILWQNRGTSFALDPAALNYLEPGRKPFHTLNPALADLPDQRLMVFGTMGGEGQPQTLAAIYSRYAIFGQDLQESVSAPRWLLGRAWATGTNKLYIEDRFAPELMRELEQAGHAVELVDPYSDWMGHAGALVRHPDGKLDAAADPRNESEVKGW
jgi:gamma-glutamyltranspeptidase/glutathione hydrolase